jgi:hypothetical protein
MEDLALVLGGDLSFEEARPGLQRLIAFVAISGIWLSLHDPDIESKTRAWLPEMEISEFATDDEIRTSLIQAGYEAELTPREMKMLEQCLNVRPEVKNDFHSNGHNGDRDQAGGAMEE